MNISKWFVNKPDDFLSICKKNRYYYELGRSKDKFPKHAIYPRGVCDKSLTNITSKDKV